MAYSWVTEGGMELEDMEEEHLVQLEELMAYNLQREEAKEEVDRQHKVEEEQMEDKQMEEDKEEEEQMFGMVDRELEFVMLG
jgi:hypothetical protein